MWFFLVSLSRAFTSIGATEATVAGVHPHGCVCVWGGGGPSGNRQSPTADRASAAVDIVHMWEDGSLICSKPSCMDFSFFSSLPKFAALSRGGGGGQWCRHAPRWFACTASGSKRAIYKKPRWHCYTVAHRDGKREFDTRRVATVGAGRADQREHGGDPRIHGRAAGGRRGRNGQRQRQAPCSHGRTFLPWMAEPTYPCRGRASVPVAGGAALQ